jgi:hypothetical protein
MPPADLPLKFNLSIRRIAMAAYLVSLISQDILAFIVIVAILFVLLVFVLPAREANRKW